MMTMYYAGKSTVHALILNSEKAKSMESIELKRRFDADAAAEKFDEWMQAEQEKAGVGAAATLKRKRSEESDSDAERQEYCDKPWVRSELATGLDRNKKETVDLIVTSLGNYMRSPKTKRLRKTAVSEGTSIPRSVRVAHSFSHVTSFFQASATPS
jgi:hypothetical protein